MTLLAAQSEVSCFQPLTPSKNFDNNTQHVISSHPHHEEEERRADGDDFNAFYRILTDFNGFYLCYAE